MASTVQPGEVLLGKYRVERVLGQGGMGVVVAARHVQLGELFAIKMLLPDALAHVEAVARFLREARAAAKLKGEHVARVHDVGSLESGMPYMVMEYLDGQDLKQVVKSRGGLPLTEAVLYVYQACEAVAEAHGNGIVHRDLKPANLFLTRRPNGSPCVKVLDFGISKELDPTNQMNSDLTRTGAFMGSPFYMSPEQMANIKAADTRTDIWAFGVILYELIVGRVPFTAQAVTELVTKVLTTSPEPPSLKRPDVPPQLDAIVLKCLEKRAEQRFQSVHELMEQLLPFAQIAAQPVAPLRAAMPSVSALPQTPLPTFAAPEPELLPTTLVMGSQPGISSGSSAGAQSVAPLPNGVTAGGWGQTNGIAGQKSKSGLVWGGVGLGAVALVAGLFFAIKSTGGDSAEPINTKPAAANTPATPVTETAPIPEPQVIPTPAEQLRPTPEAAKPATSAQAAPEEVATAKPTKTPAATNTGASTKTTKTTKSSIADFND